MLCLHSICALIYILNTTDSTKPVQCLPQIMGFCCSNIIRVPVSHQTQCGADRMYVVFLYPYYTAIVTLTSSSLFLRHQNSSHNPTKGLSICCCFHLKGALTRNAQVTSSPSHLSLNITILVNIPEAVPAPTLQNTQVLLYLSFFCLVMIICLLVLSRLVMSDSLKPYGL